MKLVTGYLEKAADEIEQTHDLWHADEDDIENIARPASNLLWRRMPDDAKGGDPIDILFLALGVGGYLVRNVQLKARLRRARQLAEAGGDQVQEGASA